MYRAKILKKVDNNHFYISFIDFGNEETVNSDDIFELPEELKKVIIFYNKNTIFSSNYILYNTFIKSLTLFLDSWFVYKNWHQRITNS